MARIARERSEKEREEVRAQVAALLEAPSGKLDETAEEIAKLGTTAVEPLLEALAASSESPEGERRSTIAARALVRISPARARDEAIRILREGSAKSRANAAFVLGFTGDPSVVPSLIEALSGSESGVRRAAARALGRLKAREAIPALAAALADPDGTLARDAFQGIRSIGSPAPPGAVAAFLRRPEATEPLLEVLDYLLVTQAKEALPAILERLRAGSFPSPAATIRAFEAVKTFASPGDEAAMGLLREYAGEGRTRDVDVRAEAGFALAALGDDSAVRERLRLYSDWIQENPRQPNAYASRGEIYLRLARGREAFSDFQAAIRAARKDRVDPAWFVGTARALCLLRRYRDAVTALRRSGLSAEARARYRDLPEFEELRTNERYRDAWEDG
jgi:tetratricopeptide (TPR) repeat protein